MTIHFIVMICVFFLTYRKQFLQRFPTAIKISYKPGQLSQCSDYVTGWKIEVRLPASVEIYLLSTTSRLAVWSIQPRIQWVPWSFSRG